MDKGFEIKAIACIHTDFNEKFGIPRQSGIVEELDGEIIFEPEYRNADAVRGLDGYSHIWLIWQFTENIRSGFSPTVRPPRLGGNTRMGVFATRSPFRPNSIGLSCVRLESIEINQKLGPVLHIKGADLMDGTIIYDIKPYIPHWDSYPDALCGFAGDVQAYALEVSIADELLEKLPQNKRSALIGVLRQDPRPSYQNDADRIYKMDFAGFCIAFTVCENMLTVTDVTSL